MPAPVPTISTVEYSSSGILIGPIQSLNFGAITPNKSGVTRIVRLNVEGIARLVSVRLGIIAANTGNAQVSDIFTVAWSGEFTNTTPSNFFPGINNSRTISDANNIAIGGITPDGKWSGYVYLNAQCPDAYFGSGECVYRWFFDYLP
jgi:hypothetical protein